MARTIYGRILFVGDDIIEGWNPHTLTIADRRSIAKELRRIANRLGRNEFMVGDKVRKFPPKKEGVK